MRERPQALPTLTALRFLAALLVFGRHAEDLYTGGRLEHPLRQVLYQGTTGVSFFFLLSGFVLAWSLREGDTRRAFWRRRVARIYPNYLVASAIGAGVVVWGGAALTLGTVVACVTLTQAFVPRNGVFLGLDGVSWSLSCEAFFYAVFPFVVPAMSRFRLVRRGVMLVALGLVFAMPWLVQHHVSLPDQVWASYIFPPVRLLEFLVGVGIGLELRARTLPPVALWWSAPLVALAYLGAGQAGLYRPDVLPIYTGYAAFTIVPFALLIVSVAQADLRCGSRPRHRWAVRLGEWSYAFYLLHFLVVRSFELIVGTRYLGAARETICVLAVLAISIAASGVLYTVVERPLERRLRHAPARLPTRVLADVPQPMEGVT